MTRTHLAISLFVVGMVAVVVGFVQADPRVAQPSNRPYAYISIIAVGAMLMIAGGLLWRDR